MTTDKAPKECPGSNAEYKGIERRHRPIDSVDATAHLETRLDMLIETFNKTAEQENKFRHEVYRELHSIRLRLAKHHRALDAMVTAEEDKAKFWKGVAEKVTTTGILGMLGLLITVIGYAITQYINNRM